ncbi:MAG: DUF3536 domain-containing protein [Candidatus Krumholzibacteriota bacterium]|nr:DUF3536 domain-containing protein [Candidatus Krumholzibacteriota bacterium]
MERGDGRRFLVIHGHFYQPPRENPWTERIDRQEGAAPWQDWNEKIAAECYEPNTVSRRLDGYGRITSIVDNYRRISFNFGPTLFSWIEANHPDLLRRIAEADRASAEANGGHGNAIAQAWGHVIMPLACRRDQETQLRWGVRDFERRFGRSPEGIWLPETAINDTTLELVAAHGFRFVVLSPYQALSIRPLGRGGRWKEVADGSIPTGRAYRCFAGGTRRGPSVDVFFYDAPLATDVSFNHLLRNGDRFADAVDAAYARTGGDLVVVATDGEVYGHHEPFADMALSYLVEHAAAERGIELVNFGRYLDEHETAWEVRLKPGRDGEGTAWSCSHGVGRWKEDCGCNTGASPGWNQRWRAPLRRGLDRLRDFLGGIFSSEAAGLLADPWQARDEYIDLLLDRSPEHAARFVDERAVRPLNDDERSRALALLEMQRHAMLMFTSCGWFFNDISGIETIQILRYAARAIELAGERHREHLEAVLLDELARAQSNVSRAGTGADVYRRARDGARVGAADVVGHHAILADLFGLNEASRLFNHDILPIDTSAQAVGDDRLVAGTVELRSSITLERSRWAYLLLAESLPSIECRLRLLQDGEETPAAATILGETAPAAGGSPRAALDAFGGRRFLLRHLSAEERLRALRHLTRRRMDVLVERFAGVYEENRDLLRLLHRASIEPPDSLLATSRAVLSSQLAGALASWDRSLSPAGLDTVAAIAGEAADCGIPLDLSPAADRVSELVAETIRSLGDGRGGVAALRSFLAAGDTIGLVLDDRGIQNALYPLIEEFRERLATASLAGEADLAAAADLLAIAERFNFDVDAMRERLG